MGCFLAKNFDLQNEKKGVNLFHTLYIYKK